MSVVLINFNDSEIQSDEDKATADEKLNEEICEKTEGQSYLFISSFLDQINPENFNFNIFTRYSLVQVQGTKSFR